MKTFRLLGTILILFLFSQIQSQDDCATSITIPFGGTLSSNNIGATLDNDYSASTGCNASTYTASHWYDVTLPITVSSINFTFTAGSIGTESSLTLVDDCTGPLSYGYIWNECDALNVSGMPNTLCGLTPGATYYIQVTTAPGNEGTFDLTVVNNPSSPPNDVCANATVVFGGTLDCGEMVVLPGPTNACPDLEATGNCVSNSDPGIWYTFDVPASYGYSAFTTNPLSANFELFSSNGGCGSLTYEACGGFILFDPTPSTTYYLLVESEVWIQPLQSVFNNSCNAPNGSLNTGDGMGGSQFGLLSCVGDSPIMPCQNESVSWHSYTVGCLPADLTINVEQWQTTVGGAATDAGIMILENDCATIMAQYDLVNGTGYVCSAIINNEDIILTDVPPGTEFVIAVGSETPNQGYYELTVTESSATGALSNDLCDDPIVLLPGVNEDFNNDCANPDRPFPTCVFQSEATVWFSYDPGPLPQDVTINIISNGLNSPAIAAYDDCLGPVQGEVCGTSLELPCLSIPIVIEIGSSDSNTGDFDIEIIESPSTTPPPLNIIVTPICSDEMSTIQVSFPAGVFGDIVVGIDPASSTDITGMQTHVFSNVNSATIDDVLTNCGTVTNNAIYTFETTVAGANCQALDNQVVQPVYPKLTPTPLLVEECLPYDLNVLASDIISGGTMPYSSYQWTWNGTIDLGTADQVSNFSLFSGGTITLTVVDANGCSIEGQVDVIAFDEIAANISADVPQACPGNPDVINLQLSIIGGGTIVSSTWTILDENNVTVTNGFPVGQNGYAIETSPLAPGNYYISADLQDANGCGGLSPSTIITILPEVNGEIILTPINTCAFYLELVFYDGSGNDIFGNGFDSNGDGIPDLFDPDGDGVPNFNDVTWITPSLTEFPNEGITFTPIEDGTYQVRITTADGCVSTIIINDVEIPDPTPPLITGDTTICAGETVILTSDSQNYLTYEWFDPMGNSIGNMSTVNFVPTESGIFLLNVVDDFGCEKSVTATIELFETPTIQLSGSTTICAGTSTVISTTYNSTWTYSWLDSMDIPLASDSAAVTLDKEGNYSLVVSNQAGCSDTTTFEITENENLILNIASQNICDGMTVTLDAGGGFDQYTWTNIGGDILNSTPQLDTDTAGLYIITVQKDQCFGLDTIKVESFESPTLNITNTADVCNNTTGSMDNVINLNDFVNNSDVGVWTSLSPLITITDPSNVDFGLIPEGDYTLLYTSTGAETPCVNITDSLIVTVSNCECPTLQIQSPDRVCLTLMEYNLNNQLSIGTNPGMWTLVSGPTVLQIPPKGIVNTDLIISGIYVFEYQLTTVPFSHCEDRDTLEVTFVDPPVLELAPNAVACNSDSPTAPTELNLNSLILTGQGGWVDPMIPNLDFSDPTALDFTGVTPGDYTITFVTSNAPSPCDDVMMTTVISVLNCDCPIIQLDPTTDLCNDGGILDLNGLQGLSESGSWGADPGNPQITDINNGMVDITGLIVGEYLFIYILDNPIPNCPARDTIIQMIVAPPSITSSLNTEACNIDLGNGDNIVDLTTLVTGDPGQWTDDMGQIITDPAAFDCTAFDIGDVIVLRYTTNTAIAPCQDVSRNINIEIKDCSCDDPEFLDPPTLCNVEGEGLDLQDLILSNHSGTWQIITTPSGASVDLNGTMFRSGNLPAGNYTMQFSIDNLSNPNCQQDWELVVTVEDQLTAETNPLLEICVFTNKGDTTILDLNEAIVDGSNNGYWIDDEGNELQTTIIDFLDFEPGNYSFTYVVPNDSPCIDDQSLLTVEAIECLIEIVLDTNIFVPNVFSPNKDGINDILYPISNISDLPVDYFYIYDRWGNKVFSTQGIQANDPNSGWNGTFDGKDVNPGVFVFQLQVQLGSGEVKSFHGDITVVR